MLLELLNLGIDVVVFGILVKLYRSRKNNLEAIKKAPVLHLDQNLVDQGGAPYAVVRGTAHAAGLPLQSQNVPGITGVVQEIVIKEHKAQWSPWSRIWRDVETEVRRSTNAVPFYLTNDSWWKMQIEVVDINQAEKLPMTVIYDHFTPYSETFSSALLGWVRGERYRGLQEIEGMLMEGTLVTGIGELVVNNKELKLRAPSNGFGYFLTSLSPEEIIDQIEKELLTLRSYATIFGCVGLFLGSWFVMSWQAKRKRDMEKQAVMKRLAEARRRRRLVEQEARARGQSALPPNQPLCVACMCQPIELLVLECGHACLCLDCGEQIGDTCPMCRGPISRTVPAFLP